AIEYQSIKQIPQPSRQTYDCLFIGRFHPQKGLDDLPAIWQGIIRHLPQAKLGVIGAGPCEITQKLKDNIARKGLNNSVTLLGFIDDEEKFKILKASAVYLFPSHYESFGATLVEAQSCGKPSVAYDLPPVVSIFKKGVLFAPLGNTYKFSQLVIQLLTDQSFYQRISLESDEHARNFSWANSAQWLLINFFPVKVSPS
ncbi:MAG: glycosyltransferase, partial [Candidatus Curtissbacteria bacterium]|nr:glycosyltransferase [Candidatus Curtissbacteria bacterium]